LSEVLSGAVRGQNQQPADHETAHDDGMEAVQDFHATPRCKSRALVEADLKVRLYDVNDKRDTEIRTAD
jgi:hypothetical protein